MIGLWKKYRIVVLLFLVWGVGVFPSNSASYHNYEQLTAALKNIEDNYPDLFHLSSLTASREGREIWLAKLGRADNIFPAMLVVAGVEGNHLIGTEMTLAFARTVCEKAKEDESLRSMLQTACIYIIPSLNPDAAESFFQSPQLERIINSTTFDDDHDGYIDEDGVDDLNRDGKISWIRVEDADGSYIEHPKDPRLLIEADPIKGEKGKWFFFQEGKDDDGDEAFNEDGLGGVNFNANFPFQYPWFTPHAGIHQMSEKETRALAEFIVDHPEIAIVMTFASNDNLLKAPDSADASNRREPQTKIRKEDAKYYEHFGELYRETIGLEKAIDTSSVEGSFSDWMYFHRGKLSLCAQVWNPEIALALYPDENEKDEESKDGESKKEDNGNEIEEKSDSKKEKPDKRGETGLKYLQWLDKNAPDSFLPWQELAHPDYPDQKAEIGGFAPFAKVLPPVDKIERLSQKHTEFLLKLIESFPRIHIREVEIKHLGADVFELTIEVENTGYLPTALAHGERTREINPTRIELDIPDESILAGDRHPRFGAIGGNGDSKKARMIITAEAGSEIQIKVISTLAGTDEQTIRLTTGGN